MFCSETCWLLGPMVRMKGILEDCEFVQHKDKIQLEI